MRLCYLFCTSTTRGVNKVAHKQHREQASSAGTPDTYHTHVICRHVRRERPALLERMALQQALPQLHAHALLNAGLLAFLFCLNQCSLLLAAVAMLSDENASSDRQAANCHNRKSTTLAHSAVL